MNDERARTQAGFRHEALLYSGADEFLEGTVPFVLEAVERDEPVLALLPPDKIEVLRRSLSRGDGAVEFADMYEIGANPARLIPAWRDFLLRRATDGHRVRGIGQPAWAQRDRPELDECDRHEALLNMAFPRHNFWLLCPYDTGALSDEVVAGAYRNHPYVRKGDASVANERFAGDVAADRAFGGTLEDAPAERTTQLGFGADDLGALRQVVMTVARRAGLRWQRACDLAAAANELATNSVRGSGRGTLSIWQDGKNVVCEVRDAGTIADPMVGRVRPDPLRVSGRGLWLVNQLCDLVQIRSAKSGTVVRVHVRVPT